MYYIGIREEETVLSFYCRNCGHVDETTTTGCVLNTQLQKKDQNYHHIVNQYTKFDPTLPRIYNIHCPNIQCNSNTDKNAPPAEIIFMRYDDANLKYIYICSVCDTTWKTDERK
jgi:hypothetical protein